MVGHGRVLTLTLALTLTLTLKAWRDIAEHTAVPEDPSQASLAHYIHETGIDLEALAFDERSGRMKGWEAGVPHREEVPSSIYRAPI